MTIDQLLQKHSDRVKILLRKYKVIGGPDMGTINAAYNKHGERFMLELMEILVPDQSKFESLIQPKAGTIANPIDTKTLQTSTPPPQKGAGFWGFWDKLLTTVSKTGETIGEFKREAASEPYTQQLTPEQEATAATRSKNLYLIAGGIVVVIILILIIRK